MMNYLKYFFFIVGIVLSFLAVSSVASAGGSCFATSPTTASFQLTGCPNPGHGALYFVNSPFWWSYTIKSSYAFCNSSGSASGLSPGTSYNFSGFDSNNLPRGSCSLSTPALVPPPPPPGTVRVMPNISSTAGWLWRLDGPGISQFGLGPLTFNNRPTGLYTVTWYDYAGYTKTRTAQSLTLTSGGIITFSNTYTLIPVPLVAAPILTSPTATSITTSSAILGANVTSTGGAPITARGTCWGTTNNPTTNCIPQGGTTTGIFSHSRIGLPTGTPIYYRGYATNSAGLTGYSSSGLFTTLWLDLTAGAVTPTTAIAGVPTTFSSTITKNGTTGTGTSFNTLFQFDDVDHATVFASQVAVTPAINVIPPGSSIASVSYTFPSGSTWYVRACADNNTAFVGTILEWQEGNNCGSWTPVAVAGAVIPTLVTLPATSITISSALLGFSFSNTGGAPITAKGLCWGTTNNPTTNCNDYGPGSGAPGEWGGVITGMPSGTLIYFRAYGTNSAGTGYSPTLSFITLTPLFSCTGTTPVNAMIYTGDDTGLSSNTPKIYSPTNTAPKCQFYCNAGTIWNGSVCTVPPAFLCTGVTPPSATIYAGDETGLVANTPKTYSATNTATKCQFSCNTGSSWNGTSCVTPTCGDNVCNGAETLLTCPRDCKTKVIQF